MFRPDGVVHATGVLSAVPYFACLDEATPRQVAEGAIRRENGAGQVIFLESEPCAGLLLVETGWLTAVKISRAGREQVIGSLLGYPDAVGTARRSWLQDLVSGVRDRRRSDLASSCGGSVRRAH